MADSERPQTPVRLFFAVQDTFCKVVGYGFHPGFAAVQKQFDPFGFRTAVVGEREVCPLVHRQLINCAQFNAVGRPYIAEQNGHGSVGIERDIVTAKAFEFVVVAIEERPDPAFLERVEPNADRKRLAAFKVQPFVKPLCGLCPVIPTFVVLARQFYAAIAANLAGLAKSAIHLGRAVIPIARRIAADVGFGGVDIRGVGAAIKRKMRHQSGIERLHRIGLGIGEPRGKSIPVGFRIRAELLLQGRYSRTDFLEFPVYFRRGQHHRGRSLAIVGNSARFLVLVEKRVERIEILLRNRVVLVVVAAGTLHGQAQKRLAKRTGAVGHVFGAVFLVNDAAFLALRVVAVETGGNERVAARIGQQVAGQLPRHEVSEWQVLVECADHPVTVRKRVAHPVVLVAVAVGVARHIHPVGGHAFAVVRRGQQPVHRFFVRPG